MNKFGQRDKVLQQLSPEQASLAEDFGNHEQIRNKLQYFIQTKKIPNLIFHGEPQSGKRTLLNEFLHNIYNGDRNKMKTHIMTVECCHGKGIKFIREELKFFAKAHIQSNHGSSFKSIVLLNADSLTIDAQSALRRCIELFSHNTRFFIVVENKERLLNPILSRFCEIYINAPKIMNGCGIRNRVEDNHAYSEGRHRNPSEYEIDTPKEPLVQLPLEDPNVDVRRTVALGDDAMNVVEASRYRSCILCSQQPDILIQQAIQWCEDGWSAHDWMHCLSNDSISDSSSLSKERLSLLYLIRMCYYKIKPDFRCEKMLMFYLLYFTLISSKQDLENMLL